LKTCLGDPEPNVPGGRKEDMKAFRAAVLVVTVALLAATAACDGLPLGGASSASGRSEVARAPASPAPTASDGTVISGCAMRVRDELEAGLASRAVRVGPAAFVSSGIHHPDRPRPGAVGNFKVMVELRPDVRVTVSLAPQATTQMSLLFDRGRLRGDNAYTLADGARTVRFETCTGRPTTFVGAVATAGPTVAPLDVTVEGGGPTRRIQLAARP
jgi:hypothetical protein